MHTLGDVESDDFQIAFEGRSISLEELFPDFDHEDRIGIVTRTGGGVLGVSVLLMGAIASFYDNYRGQNLGNHDGRLRIYPEHFIFHIKETLGTYGQLDIWPPHREVITEDDTEQILESINDRGITRLLIEDGADSEATLLKETLNSAERRIKSVLLYSPDGNTEDGDISVTNSGAISKFVLKAYEDSQDLLSGRINFDSGKLKEASEITQVYKQIDLKTGIRALSNNEAPNARTKHFIDISADGAGIFVE